MRVATMTKSQMRARIHALERELCRSDGTSTDGIITKYRLRQLQREYAQRFADSGRQRAITS